VENSSGYFFGDLLKVSIVFVFEKQGFLLGVGFEFNAMFVL